MGLDCIPAKYPCKEQGLAVLDENDKIDCARTQQAGMCPWMERMRKFPPHLGEHGAVLGIFGTDCWFRGKMGTFMIGDVIEELPSVEVPLVAEQGFYGDEVDVEESDVDGTPEHCKELAVWMADHTELYAKAVTEQAAQRGTDIEAELNLWSYAEWWLRFAGEECGGFHAWY